MRPESSYEKVMAMRRGIGLTLSLICFAALAPAVAQASFHLTKIGEIRAAPSPFIELKMYASGQNFFSGHTVTTYSSSGSVLDTVPLQNVSSGLDQRTVLIAPGPVDGINPDITHSLTFSGPGGAVCFEAIDCVSYGSFSGTGLPSQAGTPVPGYPSSDAGQSLTRRIDRGCDTLLEASDDTDDSAADFTIGAATPQDNSVGAFEFPCGGSGVDRNPPKTTITKGPEKRSEKTKAKFRFSSNESGSKFECKLDKKPFKSCQSPRKYKNLDPGKHKFQVVATDRSGNEDKTPAKYKFKVLEE